MKDEVLNDSSRLSIVRRTQDWIASRADPVVVFACLLVTNTRLSCRKC